MSVIYVLPTQQGQPPRAVIGEPTTDGIAVFAEAVWSADSGAWTIEDSPVDDELGELITDHARNLGVPGF